MTLPEQGNSEVMLQKAHDYARRLAVERHAADQDAALELASDQGRALRVVIACAASAIVDALGALAVAIHDGPQR